MAKPVNTVILLFFFFAVSHARLTLLHAENNQDHAVEEFKPSDNSAADKILLPTQKPESEPDVQFVDESADEPDHEISSESNEPETETTQPLTVISFRPLNRQFPIRPLIPFRHRHNCRHGRHQMRPWVGPRFRPRDFSHVNDMILPQDEGFGFDPAVADARPLRPRGVRSDIGPARFPSTKKSDSDKVTARVPSKKYDSDKVVKRQHERHDHDDNDAKPEMGGFASKIRKFLGQF